ncbi:GNAT family N-acetyltransferase [Flammeovirga agarivorans]|uniref:GNAT family N-acetyltransferase n=1 Tax=Flammeovirga agarivorans TaxID=2726742 RepID=A0A7X8SJP4_9BACT|nr:GNAT family N-acetyltransferase [Flammeovirga agarivorans]NLR91420.1 GNAT family N-acetyltransferase [Flammeovirga agarivorans]
MDIQIQQAKINSIHKINEMIDISVNVLQKKYYKESTIIVGKELIQGIEDLILNHSFYIATLDHKIIGCGGFKIDTIQSDITEFKSFFVHPDYAKQGIGSLLLEYCISLCKKLSLKKIVLTSTLSGVPLYHKFGFEKIKSNQILLSNNDYFEVIEMQRSL